MNSEQTSASVLEIAHVLFMDIVSYSKLPMDEQQRAITQLQDAVRGTTEFRRAQEREQLIRLPTGDGMALVFFGSPESAARCAVELSRALHDKPLPLRIGLHTGPVYRMADINANRNVSGGGINMAQRVMDCGDAGHILVSATAAEMLGQLSSWADNLHELGDAEVKHGVRIHVFNLYNPDAGNPELPNKFAALGHGAGRKVNGEPAGAVANPAKRPLGWFFAHHLLTLFVTIPVFVGLTWRARADLSPTLRLPLFLLTCLALGLHWSARFAVLSTAYGDPGTLTAQLQRARPWLRWSCRGIMLGLVAIAVSIANRNEGLAAVLIALAMGSLVWEMFIDPAVERASLR